MPIPAQNIPGFKSFTVRSLQYFLETPAFLSGYRAQPFVQFPFFAGKFFRHANIDAQIHFAIATAAEFKKINVSGAPLQRS
jgi:hypothetical protein